jgi:hypothetical protein
MAHEPSSLLFAHEPTIVVLLGQEKRDALVV